MKQPDPDRERDRKKGRKNEFQRQTPEHIETWRKRGTDECMHIDIEKDRE